MRFSQATFEPEDVELPHGKVRYRVFVTSKGHRQLYIDGEEHRRLAALRASMTNASASDDDSDDDG